MNRKLLLVGLAAAFALVLSATPSSACNFTSSTVVATAQPTCSAATTLAKNTARAEVTCESNETPQLVVWHETTACTQYVPGCWKEGGYYTWACIMC